ncbi:MAG: class I SAM-dependent methyltransferase [Ruminococcus sp.]|nr:class I SAM-dependent methyltransferase [Ruminococcus sp.]
MSYGIFAEFYDELTQNVGYDRRAAYLAVLLAKFGHSAGLTLDLACGTGSLTLELAKLGVDIYGVDASEEMLSVAQEKAFEQNIDTLFLCQKMQELDLYGTIDTCICSLDSVNHLTDIKDVEKAFERVSLFMNRGGYFVFDANTVYKHKEILADNTFVYDTDNVYCVWQNSLKENNIVDIDLTFFVPDGETYTRYDESFSERAYSREELTELLNKTGFELQAVYGDMGFQKPHENEQRIIVVAKKM